METEISGLTFRIADPADLDVLVQSRLRAVRTYRGLPETAPLPELEAAVRDYYRWALEAGTHVAVLALRGTRLVATGGLDLRREMPSYGNPAGRSGYIMNIWTDPEFRGRGIAWKVLDILTAAARERGCLSLSLHATDMGRPLYRRYGFSVGEEMLMDLCPAGKTDA